MNTIHEMPREIPVRDEVDVLVIGGGTAGPAAAIAAARHGAKDTSYRACRFPGAAIWLAAATGFHGVLERISPRTSAHPK